MAGSISRYNPNEKEQPEPNCFDVDIGEPLELEGDFMIVGDIHVPTTDYLFSQNILPIAKKLNIKRLIIAGDLFNMDLFSSYDKVIKDPSWSQELAGAKVLLSEWRGWFDEIYFIMGNHERRFEKWSNGVMTDRELMSLLDGKDIVSSNFGWCTVKTPAGEYRVTHPKNYSVNQLNVADALAHKTQQHIISAHEHHLAKGWDRYGNFVVTNIGGLFDFKKMAYVVLDDSKCAGMKKGFAALVNGVIYPFGEYPFTDWDWWME